LILLREADDWIRAERYREMVAHTRHDGAPIGLTFNREPRRRAVAKRYQLPQPLARMQSAGGQRRGKKRCAPSLTLIWAGHPPASRPLSEEGHDTGMQDLVRAAPQRTRLAGSRLPAPAPIPGSIKPGLTSFLAACHPIKANTDLPIYGLSARWSRLFNPSLAICCRQTLEVGANITLESPRIT
jgi:hypothetical protein